MASVPEWVKKITHEWSTDRYSPEYDEFNYNHLYQGVIALWQLGANEEQCQRFAEFRSKKLEPAEEGKDRVETGKKLLDGTTLTELLGKRKRFNDLIAHFRQRLVDLGNDWDQLINTELPKLSLGFGAGAFHGIIQLGYGYLSNDERLLCEGLAYLHFGNISFIFSETTRPDMGKGDTDVLALLKEIKDDGQLAKFADDKRLKFNDGRDRSKFAMRMLTLLTLKGDELVTLANRIKLPDWFDRSSFDTDQLRRLGHWIVDQAIVLYVQSEKRNNFYLLHGVTSAWALCQILPLLTDQREALRTVNLYLASVFAAYISILCPAVSVENAAGLELASWEQIVEKNLEIASDEHVYKVVHVCQYRNKENQDEAMREVYRTAAHICTYTPFTYL